MRLIRINDNDNVAIVTASCPKGTPLDFGITALSDTPIGHKIALADLKQGDPVFRYGVLLGHLTQDVKKGAWINEFMLDLPSVPALDDLSSEYNPSLENPVAGLKAPRTTFMGYEVPGCRYAGTRNILGITMTVQCAAGVVEVAVRRMKKELLPRYPNVDDIVAVRHPYGCGVAINAPDADIPIRSVRNLARNPNFGGQLMVVALGCEKLTLDKILSPEENNSENVIVLQDCDGFAAMLDALMIMADRKLSILNGRRRTELPLSRLCIGLQCGGSDAFSGITSNPSAGYASDLLVSAGATVMFSEVTEVRDGVHAIARRCLHGEDCTKLAYEMRWYDEYLAKNQVDRSANPTPGNKKGGLSNIVEKAMGSIAKSGRSPISQVIGPGELPTRSGLIFAATPASDIVCGPCQLASGITLEVFMTGRGTPYGLAIAPVLKVSSKTELGDRWRDLIDVNAGVVADGTSSISEVGTDLFNLILDVASGTKQSKAEELGLFNDFLIFNPAPIT